MATLDRRGDARQRAAVPDAVLTFLLWAWALLTATAVAWLVYTFALRLLVLVVPVAVALLFTAVLKPAVDWGQRHGVNRTLSTVVVLLGALGAVVVVGWVTVPRVADQLMELRTALSDALRSVQEWLRRGPLNMAAGHIDQLRRGALRTLPTGPTDLASLGLRGARVAFMLIAGLALTLFFTFFFVRDGNRFATWLSEHAPARWRAELRAAGSAGWLTLTDYLRGLVAQAGFNGVATAIVLLAVGVPLVISLAIVEFVFSFVPVVGALLAGALAALVTLATNGPADALVVVAAAIVIEQLEGNVVGPVVMGHAVDLHPVVVTTAVTVGAVSAGLIGAFLAVPLVAALSSAVPAAAAAHGGGPGVQARERTVRAEEVNQR